MPHPLEPDLTAIAAKTAGDLGFDLVNLQIQTHLRPMTVQIQVCRSDGGDVTLDDCAGFSTPLGDAIEASSALSEAYVLEVSSPGIGELLESDRDFQTFRGFPVDVTTSDDAGSQHTVSGSLLSRDTDHLEINIKGRVKRIPRVEIHAVRLTSPTG